MIYEFTNSIYINADNITDAVEKFSNELSFSSSAKATERPDVCPKCLIDMEKCRSVICDIFYRCPRCSLKQDLDGKITW